MSTTEPSEVVSSTLSEGARTRAKYKVWTVWMRLFLAMVCPLSGVVLLSVFLVLASNEEANAAQTMDLNFRCVGLINNLTHQLQLERGISASWIFTSGSNGNPPYSQRLTVNEAVHALDDFIDINLNTFPYTTIMNLALLQDFTVNIEAIRALVDAMPNSPSETFQAYTDGIAVAHDLVVHLGATATLLELSFLALSVVDIMEMKESLGKKRGFFSAALSAGNLSLSSVTDLRVFVESEQHYIKMVLEKAGDRESAAVNAMLASDAVQKAVSLDEQYLLAVGSAGSPERGLDYFQVQTGAIEAVFSLLAVMLEHLEEGANTKQWDAIAAQIALSVGITVSVAVGIGIMCMTACGVTVPFASLYTASKKLHHESAVMTRQCEAIEKFVPHGSLQLIGVNDIMELHVGRLVLKRMTVMVGDIVSFTALSSKLVPDDVFRYINSWLGCIIPGIQDHGGVVDKILGDGIVCFFASADAAVQAGTQIFQSVAELNRSRKVMGVHQLRFGLALNSGNLWIGTIGTSTRMSIVTGCSPVVQRASDVEAQTRQFHVNMLVTGHTYDLVTKDKDRFRKVGRITESGSEPLWLYECVAACWTAAQAEAKQRTLQTFEEGVAYYYSEQLDRARLKFKEVCAADPMDMTALSYSQALDPDDAASVTGGANPFSWMQVPEPAYPVGAQTPTRRMSSYVDSVSTVEGGSPRSPRQAGRGIMLEAPKAKQEGDVLVVPLDASAPSGSSAHRRGGQVAAAHSLSPVDQDEDQDEMGTQVTYVIPSGVPSRDSSERQDPGWSSDTTLNMTLLQTVLSSVNRNQQRHKDDNAVAQSRLNSVVVQSGPSTARRVWIGSETAPVGRNAASSASSQSLLDSLSEGRTSESKRPSFTHSLRYQKRMRKVKMKLLLKLTLMLLVPLVSLVVVAVVTMLKHMEVASHAGTLVTLSNATGQVNQVTLELALERDAAVMHMLTGDAVFQTQWVSHKHRVNTAFAGLETFVAAEKENIPRPVLMKLWVCMSSVPEKEEILGVTDVMQVFASYNAALTKCHQFLTHSLHFIPTVSAALRMTMFVLLYDTKVGLDRMCMQMTLDASFGRLNHTFVQQMEIGRAVRAINLHRAIHLHRASLQALDHLQANVPESLKKIEEMEAQLFEFALSDPRNMSLPKGFHATCMAISHELAEGFTNSTVQLHQNNEDEVADTLRQTVLYVTVIGVGLLCGIGIGLWASRGITQPYDELQVVKHQLGNHKVKLLAQRAAGQAFVPYMTLEVLGCTDISQLQMGTSCLKELTVIFVAVKDYNMIGGRLTAAENISFLNTWLQSMIPLVMSEGGIVDKLMGDSILILFENTGKGLRAIINLFKSVQGRNDEIADTEAEPMFLNVGMNIGDVCLGTIGTAGRMETTALGDTVNVASRVLSLSRMYQTPFLCTHAVHAHLQKQQLSFRALGPAMVKGRSKPVEVLEVLDAEPQVKAKKLAYNEHFQTVCRAFNAERHEVALQGLKKILQVNPNDGPCLYFKKWIEEGPVEFVK